MTIGNCLRGYKSFVIRMACYSQGNLIKETYFSVPMELQISDSIKVRRFWFKDRGCEDKRRLTRLLGKNREEAEKEN